jgi:nicotinate-nucleotide pyrophosphorylase (carboxylating)
VPELETYAEALARVIREGLAEDVGPGDVTTRATVPDGVTASGELRLKAPGVIAGLDAFAAVFAALDPAVEVQALVGDGDRFDDVPRDIARVRGPARALLTGERLALNLLQRMSGIATETRRYVDAVAGTGVEILDTRKTAPGLRMLDKRAVLAGGGTNHRRGLYDAILIKDNHIAVAGGVAAVLKRAKAVAGHLVKIEIEVDTLDQLREVLAVGGADVALVDNMTPAMLRDAVALNAGRLVLEASGGITLATAAAVAETGVDYLSSGAITHSSPGLDVALDIEM